MRKEYHRRNWLHLHFWKCPRKRNLPAEKTSLLLFLLLLRHYDLHTTLVLTNYSDSLHMLTLHENDLSITLGTSFHQLFFSSDYISMSPVIYYWSDTG